MRYGEIARIRVRLTAYNGVKLSVAYRVEDAATGQERAAGESTHAFLDSKTGMPLRLRRACPELDEILQVQIRARPGNRGERKIKKEGLATGEVHL